MSAACSTDDAIFSRQQRRHNRNLFTKRVRKIAALSNKHPTPLPGAAPATTFLFAGRTL